MTKSGYRRILLGTASLAASIWVAPAVAAEAAAKTADAATATDTRQVAEVLVTARRREERLISVPVAVTALSAKEVERYNAADLTKIGEMTPTVIIGAYKANGGGSIAIRGISSPANQTGFEQAVSVAIDGVQTSNGRVAQLGFFDVQQVEVMKGPQALFFGKNSPAGVIALSSRGPTSEFEATGRASYEFIAGETTTDVGVGGPLSQSWGARVAVRYRNMDGWLRNLAQPIANPFYRAATGAPAGAAQLPGAADRRPGDDELLGRLTLEFRPGGDFKGVLKITGVHGNDSGAGVATQNIGPCSGPNPRVSGIADPFGECRVDNKTTVGDLPLAIAQSFQAVSTDGRPFGELNAVVSALSLETRVAGLRLSSLTGFNHINYDWLSGLDQTTYSQLGQFEGQNYGELSQEFRVTSDSHGPLNFMLGAYFQTQDTKLRQEVKLNDGGYVAASGRFISFDTVANQRGRTYSAFGQILYNVTDQIELAGGVRWTRETKDFDKQNLYGTSVFNTAATSYAGSSQVGVLQGHFKDSNLSPEATLTWRPDSDRTVYVAYKTGFKSGGFGMTNPLQVSTRIADVDFESEKAKGFEFGAKGLFLENVLRLGFTAFAYEFSNLQVNTYDPAKIAYTINNAGNVRQRGADLEANYRATDGLTLHGAVAYVNNRFHNFTGQCYGYTFPTGTTRATGVAPPNCSFANDTTLTLQQVFDGRAPARSPDWSGNAGFVYEIPMAEYKLSLTGDAYYSGRYYASETMASSTLQNSFWRLNASVVLSAPNDRWAVSLVGRNLANKYYLLYAADRTGGTGVPGAVGEQRGVVSRGREILLQASVRF